MKMRARLTYSEDLAIKLIKELGDDFIIPESKLRVPEHFNFPGILVSIANPIQFVADYDATKIYSENLTLMKNIIKLFLEEKKLWRDGLELIVYGDVA